MSPQTLRERGRGVGLGAGSVVSSDPFLGEVFTGRYRLIEPLEMDEYGRRLFRARDDILARDVAVAVFAVDASRRRRLSAVRTLAAVDHPSLVTLYDAQVVGDGNAYVVMEFVAAPSLRRHVQKAGRLAPKATAALVADLAGGLAAIHQVGIVHGRVTSSSVRLRPRRDASRPFAPVLTGFDIGHLGGTPPPSSEVARRRAYLTPEELRGEVPGTASDVYALGLLALEALTGEPPLDGGPIQEFVLAPLAYDPDIPARFGFGWRALLTAMTDPDPGRRPDAAAVAGLAAELRETDGVPLRRPEAMASTSAPVPALHAADLLRAASSRRRPIWAWVTHYR